MTSRMQELLGIMERLRAPDGCPWDREQTFASIAPYTIEEAYEVADAIEREDLVHLKDELGDLLFQVVFHAQIARERGAFDFEAAAGAICDKLRRRHPHVFAGQGRLSAAEQSVVWENIKAEERSDARRGGAAAASALDGVPRALPALMRAHKLSKRAARVGFDFEHASQTADKVAEELAEVREAATAHEAAAALEIAARGGVAGAHRPPVPRGRFLRKSATCCSPRPISRASSTSMPRRHCAQRMRNSRGAFAPWKRARPHAGRSSRA